MPLPRGTRLGPYEISALIGAGGMGEVYRARDSRLDRSVAIKTLHEQAGSTAWERSNHGSQYAVTADGERFLVNNATDTTLPITLVLNWTAALKK